MTKNEQKFYQAVLKLLNGLQAEYSGDDHLIAAILQVALSCHLWDCANYPMAQQAVNYLGGSFDELFQTLLPQGSMAEGSNALH